MSDTNLVDKIVENKFLLVFQRLVTPLIMFIVPITFAYFAGLGASVTSLEQRFMIKESRDAYITEQRDEDFAEIKAAVLALTAQNTVLLTAITRLETLVKQQ